MDGGRMIHGVERTKPSHHVATLPKGAFNRIEYQGNETWYMMTDDSIVDIFNTDDFRMTFVWRGLCFRDDAEKVRFEAQMHDLKDLDVILKMLEADLHKNGKLSKLKTVETMGKKAFGKLLQNVYMQYPLDAPNAWFAVNYCALSYNRPWLKWLMSPICTDVKPVEPLNDDVPPANKFCDPLNRERRMTNCPEGYQEEN